MLSKISEIGNIPWHVPRVNVAKMVRKVYYTNLDSTYKNIFTFIQFYVWNICPTMESGRYHKHSFCSSWLQGAGNFQNISVGVCATFGLQGRVAL